MPNPIELSVVILCYRAEQSIVPFIDTVIAQVNQLNISYQLVLVGNYVPGSDDKTKDYVKEIEAKNNFVKAVVEPKNGMMGWDMRKGMMAADGNYILVIDGDGQFPIESVNQCYQIIKAKKLDLVKTYRIERHDGFYRGFISKVYNIIFNIFFPGMNNKDANSKPKVISRAAYEQMQLSSNDWFIDAEIMINVRRLKLKFEEIPVVFSELKGRTSFVKVAAILEFMRNLIIYRIKEFGK